MFRKNKTTAKAASGNDLNTLLDVFMVAAWKKERRILYISGRIMYVIGDSPVLNSFCTGEQKNILRIQTRAQI